MLLEDVVLIVPLLSNISPVSLFIIPLLLFAFVVNVAAWLNLRLP